MLSRILVPMDGSEMARRALEYALENHPDAEITVVHVAGGLSSVGEITALALDTDLEAAAEERAEAVFEDARSLAAEHGAEITTEVRLGYPARAILNRADGVDAIVIGSHEGSLADRLVVGDVAQKVVRNAPVPVTVAR